MLFFLAGRLSKGGLVCLTILLISSSTFAENCATYGDLINNGAYGLLHLKQGNMDGCHLDDLYVPASVVKLATAYTAFKILGPDYRFQTHIYQDDRDNLYVKGFGDPFLTSESVNQISVYLSQMDISEVHDLVIDDTAYALEHLSPGSELSDNPYDAPVGATAVNFNSVAFTIDNSGGVHSGEFQTPLLPIMQEKAMGRKPGSYRVNICSTLGEQQRSTARYTAQLFQSFLRKNNIRVTGSLSRRSVPENARLLYVFHSEKRLEDLVKSMLYYSSNFTANQIFLACGARRYGFPATWNKGVKAEQEILQSILDRDFEKSWKISDGAGLSRENRLSVRFTLNLLNHFVPYRQLLRKKYGVSVKSGTMQGIYNYAGYLDDNTAFVIFLNQPGNKRNNVLQRLVHHRTNMY
ncbi:D-alanyl-D-alanine carboxypeptidase/D-alanyl-D-alanine-endopeptidase [Desulfogranum japonicum]|uniref:D-alanyl-D-alanine carboxypeptidase/D-alanyl-D-alanine-endopeptidase n=1 Tax=Desulfogranum japonicum TaxID=231447 RepID=UPI001378E2C4|nr:D-alanyl-D-alanine carboxypeptidase [Desulfogranum japonicum]